MTAVAGQDNQFLGLHGISYLYAATKQASQETDGSALIGISAGPPASGFTRLAESFATGGGQTAVGYFGLYGKAVGNGCDLQAQLFTNSASKPTTQVGSTAVTLPADFWSTSNGWVYLPLPITGLSTSTTYHLVLIAGDTAGNNAGDASNYITLEKSNQSSGASTYAAATWTNQAYGFMYREFDQTVSGELTMVWEDAGVRWTWLGYDGSGNVSGANEYTIAQGTGKMRSLRTVTESSGYPTAVA